LCIKIKAICSTIVIWLIFWLSVVGGSIYVLPIIGADQYHKFYITAFYFLSFAIFGAYFYKINYPSSHCEPFSKQLIYFISAAVILIIICMTIDNMFSVNANTLQKIIYSKFYFPLFKWQTLITKICDVFFQQVLIFGFLNKLRESKLSNTTILLLFTACFFIIHIPLIFNFNILYALYFIIPSLLAGVVFSYFILNFRYGQSISFAVHLFYYLLIGLYLRY
jgi:hypothetical protein